MDDYVWLTQFVVMFVYVFLKGFQHQAVIGANYKTAFSLSYLMAACAVVEVTLTVQEGYASILPMGTGAALGIVTSIYLYRRFNGKTNSSKEHG